MKEDNFIPVLVFLAAAMILWLVWDGLRKSELAEACKEKGGHYVRTTSGPACARLELVK